MEGMKLPGFKKERGTERMRIKTEEADRLPGQPLRIAGGVFMLCARQAFHNT
jgi:hypothetical protein